MAWTTITDFVLDQLTTYQDLNEILGNLDVLKEFPKGLDLGGDPAEAYEVTTYTELVYPRYVKIPTPAPSPGRPTSCNSWAM